jgi:Secretory lipase
MRIRLLAPVGVLLVAALTAACAPPPPPSFYTPPADLPDRPGDVIGTAETQFGTGTAASSTAIKYRSTDATGQPNYVTGTLLVPRAAWTGAGPRPVVAFAPGTQGLGDDCAPSKWLPAGTFYGIPDVQAMLDRGWAVAVTDYEKLGTPGDHTYVVKDAEAHALLDIVRAAQRLPGSGVAADAPVAIWGYSQGGQAAAAAAEATYAPELDVHGVVAGGVPSDLGLLAQHLSTTGNLFFTFLAYAAVGLDSAYPELDLESYLNETGRSLIGSARESCVGPGLLIGAGRRTQDLTTTDPLQDPVWQARIAEQRLGEVAPQAPVFQYHTSFDEVIPVDLGRDLRDAWCAGGARVQYIEYPLAEHVLGEIAGDADGLAFLEDRFAGQPFTPTCNA